MNRWILHTVAFAAMFQLVGCAGFDRDLDTRRYPGPAVSMTDEQAQETAAKVRQLRSEADKIRISLSRETDRSKRIDNYRALRDLSLAMAPMERQLAAAGRPTGRN